MVHFHASCRRRRSLALIALLVLQWAFGLGTAAAEVICFEPGGHAVLEAAGSPCKDAALERQTGTACLDVVVSDAQQGQAAQPLPSPVLPDLAPFGLNAAWAYFYPAVTRLDGDPAASVAPPDATHPVLLRKSTVLLI